jgi:predicted Zn-dependent protease
VNRTERDLATDKIKLIFEFNHSSPLFARVAASEMESANILDAIKILETGLEQHAHYPTPYLLLALANAYAGREEEARSNAIMGSELLGSSVTLDFYLEKISNIIFERNSLSQAKRPAFLTEEKKGIVEDEFENLEDKLDILAERLSKAKIIPKAMGETMPEFSAPEVKIKRIVSDTMAEIFLSQKNYKEAISIYEELLEQKPNKADFYLQKITDLKSLIE